MTDIKLNIDGYEFRVFQNVLHYTLISPYSCNVEIDNKSNYKSSNYDEVYFIIDSPNQHAFGHWFYDSVIYMPMFYKLKTLYSNIKIALSVKMNYKLLVLKHFGIIEDDIVYTFRSSHNICIFPLYESHSLNSTKCLHQFEFMISNLFDHFTMNNKKNIDVMIMPRHKTENNHLIERMVDTIDIENKLKSCKNCCVLDTSTTITFNEQILCTNQSKIIIVPDGSSLIVNGIFARNSRIITLGITTLIQSIRDTPKVKNILLKISRNNEIIIVPISNKKIEPYQKYTYDMIQPLLSGNDIAPMCENLCGNIYVYQKTKIIDIDPIKTLFCKPF